MRKLYYLLFLCIAYSLTAQDSLAKYTSTDLAGKAVAAAQSRKKPFLWKTYLDGMMRKKPSDSSKADIYYNLAWELYRNQDCNLDVSINMLNKGLVFSKKADYKPVTLFCLESLSTFYALKNDNEKALESLDEMKKIGSKISEESSLYVTFQASTARVYSIIGDFKKSISIVKKSNIDINTYISKHPDLPRDSLDELNWIEEGNYVHLAQSYNYQKQLDSAAFCIKKAKEYERKRFNKKLQNNIWVQEAFYLILSKKYDDAVHLIGEAEKKGYIDSKNKQYRSLYYLALSSYSKKEYGKSLSYCEKALEINVRIASFMNFELEIYNLAVLNSEKLQNSKKLNYYLGRYNQISRQYDYRDKSKFIANIYGQDVSLVKQELESQKSNKKILLILFLLILGVCCYLFWHFIKTKKDRKQFETIISSIENNEPFEFQQQPTEDSDVSEIILSSVIDRKSVKVSSEVDERIIKQLDKFEKKEKFLSPNISLSNMASDFNTNSVYLSAVIKNHKGKSFNKYINDLRIEYIIKKLKTSSEYSNYKIAYLAQECGFSSHTVFIRIFTEKTGLTPSKFLNFLKNEQI